MSQFKRILVTGGAGFIGSHTVDLLLRQGYTVRVLDSLAPPVHIAGQLPVYFPRAAEFMQGDVRDKAAWERALAGIDDQRGTGPQRAGAPFLQFGVE